MISRRVFYVKLVLLVFCILASLVLYATRTHADTACAVAGTVPITDAATRDQATAAGIPTNQPCWDPNSNVAGVTEGQAKQYLISLPKKCIGKCAAPPDAAHIQKLDAAFSICAANFLKAYIQKVGPVYITSAYRDGASGENSRAGGAPNSNHTKGLAMDVYPNSGNYKSMWDFAKQNPSFGVCFPYLGDDNPHMTLAGINTGEAAKCKAQGITQKCSGTPPVNVSYTPGAPTTPMSGVNNALQNMFGTQQPSQPPALAQTPATSIAQQPLSNAFQQPTPVSSQLPTPQLSSNIATPVSSLNQGASSATQTASSTTNQSSLDLLNALAGPSTQTATSATGTTLALNQALTSTSKSNQTISTSTAKPADPSAPPVNLALIPMSPSTFVSPDLNQNLNTYTYASPSTFSGAVLASIKQTLLSILAILQPFGPRTLVQ